MLTCGASARPELDFCKQSDSVESFSENRLYNVTYICCICCIT